MQQWIERTAWVLLTGLLFWLWNGADRDATDLSHLLEDQHATFERQTAQLDSLAVVLSSSPDSTHLELKRDLMSKPDVITVPGVLGGTMRIFSESDIRILNESWVYAQFDDGHIQAAGLFEYTRARDGSIRWKLLESRQF
jgi:hypothetical protein